jgi:hypothetical protein
MVDFRFSNKFSSWECVHGKKWLNQTRWKVYLETSMKLESCIMHNSVFSICRYIHVSQVYLYQNIDTYMLYIKLYIKKLK